MDGLSKKQNLMFIIGMLGNSHGLFLKLTMLGVLTFKSYIKCKRALTELIICTKEQQLYFEAHDLMLYPGDLVRKLNGRVHSDNGPAVEYNPKYENKRYFNFPIGLPRNLYLCRNGVEYWQNNKLHRLDGPARIFKGGEEWLKDGKPHRLNGPALILTENHDHDHDLKEVWWCNGAVHRDDGPAITYRDGTTIWYTHGVLTDPK